MEPSINVYRDLIAPLGERIRTDPRFADVKNVVYDTDELAFTEMPAIEYYVESPWEDFARGSGSYTLQTRRMLVRVIFNLWVYDSSSRQNMDEALFYLGGHLMDFLRDMTDFNPIAGVGLGRAPLVWQVTRPETQTGFVGLHQITAEYEIYSGLGK